MEAPPWITIALAALLDAAWGDPLWFPHPVRGMGWAIQRMEVFFRSLPVSLVLSGAFFALSLILAAYGLAWGFVWIASGLHPLWGTAVEAALIYTCLSIRSLNDAALGVENALKRQSLEQAKHQVSMIVSRDTSALDRAGVCRAAVETVGENFVDGVLSPLFFTVIGGAPLAVAFKMASTLDSMVGYENETYRLFGKAAARIDDLANFLPARLSLPLIALAAQILGKTGRRCLETACRDGGLHKSPNAGWPEAAFAGALGVRLAGPGVYHGRLNEKPFFGADFNDPVPSHIQKARDLMILASFLAVFLALAVVF